MTAHASELEVELLRELESFVRCYAWRPGKDVGPTARKKFDDTLVGLQRVRKAAASVVAAIPAEKDGGKF